LPLVLDVRPTAEEVAAFAAQSIVDMLRRKPDAVLGLPTGNTAIPVYRELVAAHRNGLVSFGQATILNVDEYVGVGPDDPGSFAFFMREHLLRHVDLPPERFHIPNGLAENTAEEAGRYEALIASLGGLDLLLLGLGRNGHIAFNEPGSSRESRTRLVQLAPMTIEANNSGSSGPPIEAITIGIATILEARRILLAVTGRQKRTALRAMLSGAPVRQCPASALNGHPDVLVLADEEAAGAAAEPAAEGPVERRGPHDRT
jgi:glucosamine-6-phosphate deaminase